jgi:hypothetical protein
MKTKYEIGIAYSDMFKNESFSQLINNLEKLDIMTDEVFAKINKNVINCLYCRY